MSQRTRWQDPTSLETIQNIIKGCKYTWLDFWPLPLVAGSSCKNPRQRCPSLHSHRQCNFCGTMLVLVEIARFPDQYPRDLVANVVRNPVGVVITIIKCLAANIVREIKIVPSCV